MAEGPKHKPDKKTSAFLKLMNTFTSVSKDKNQTEDVSDAIIRKLQGYNDNTLFILTEQYWQRLEEAIERYAQHVSKHLLRRRVINSAEFEKVKALTKSQQCDAVHLIFTLVCQRGPCAVRNLWDIIAEIKNMSPKLSKIMKEIIDEDASDPITKVLQSYNDSLLLTLTEFYWRQLEQAIEECVPDVATQLLEKQVINSNDCQKVIAFAENAERHKATHFIFTLIFQRGAVAARMLWDILVEMQNNNPTVKQILNEILDKDAIKRTLDGYSEHKLLRIIEFYQQKLEDAIQEFVPYVASDLFRKSELTTDELQKVKELSGKDQPSAASQHLFNLMSQKGVSSLRSMWNTFAEIQNTKPKLSNVLKDIVDNSADVLNDAAGKGLTVKLLENPKDMKDPIIMKLQGYNDHELLTITKFYQQRLEAAVEQFVQNVSEQLLGRCQINLDEFEKVNAFNKAQQLDAAHLVFYLVFQRGSEALRNLWRIFAELKDISPKLNKIMREFLDEDARDPITIVLHGYNDQELLKLTEFYRQRLEQAIEECVSDVAAQLLQKHEINLNACKCIQEMTASAENAERREATHFVFNLMLLKGATAMRQLWDILVEMQHKNPTLKEILKEILDKDEINKMLDGYNEHQLLIITEFHRQRLEEAIEEFVPDVASYLYREQEISMDAIQEVKELAFKGHRSTASRHLFDLMFQGGAGSLRTMWDIFSDIQEKKPKLHKILREIVDKGSGLLSDAAGKGMSAQIPEKLAGIQNTHKNELRAKYEKLQIDKYKQGENQGAASIDAQYTELVISSSREMKHVEHDLLKRGREHENLQKKHMNSELERIRSDQLFGSSFGRRSTSGTAVVIGIPGVGKTTLVQKIVYDWAKGKLYPQFHFVFHFKFRDITNTETITTLNEMLLKSYPDFHGHLANVWKEPETILFTLDGLDEFTGEIDFSEKASTTGTDCLHPESRGVVSDIVRGLVQGKLLKGCSVLLTSRPTDLRSLRKEQINLWAEILGFLSEEIKDYFTKYFGNSETAEEAYEYVMNNDVLFTMCYIPFYCSILCPTLAPLLKQNKAERKLPSTITLLYANYLSGLLQRSGGDIEGNRDLLVRLGRMAHVGIRRKRVVFYDGDFTRAKLKPSHFTSIFMMQILEKDETTEHNVHTFIHITVQEFVAAFAILISSDAKNLTGILREAQEYRDGRFDIFVRFLVGLSSDYSTQYLTEVIGELPQDAIRIVIDWLKEEVKANIKTPRNKRTLLNALYLLFESGKTELMRDVFQSMKKVDFVSLPLSPVDCTVLATVLGPCEDVEELNLNNCFVQEEGIQRLAPILHKCQQLRLMNNKLQDAGVNQLCVVLGNNMNNCKIQTLDLRQNQLSDACAEKLCSTLCHLPSLENINLSSDYPHICSGNSFTERSVPAFWKLVEKCKSLKAICLTGNPISSDGKEELKKLEKFAPGFKMEFEYRLMV